VDETTEAGRQRRVVRPVSARDVVRRHRQRRFGHGEGGRPGHAVVVGGVGGGEGDRQAVAAGGQHGAEVPGGGGGAGHVGGGVELRVAQRGAVGDGRGVRPGDARRRLVHGERHAGAGAGVVGRVGRGEGHAQRVRAGGQDGADVGAVGEAAGHVG